MLAPQPAQPHPGARAVLPVNYWNNGEFKNQLDLRHVSPTRRWRRCSPDDVSTPKAKAVRLARRQPVPAGGTRLPAGAGRLHRRVALLRQSGHVRLRQCRRRADRVYVSNESEDAPTAALVNADGTLTDLQPFAERGGESVAVDAEGNVYVANGQIFVYDRVGQADRPIDVPERPLRFVFGGADGRTLFILTHHALFAVRVRG